MDFEDQANLSFGQRASDKVTRFCGSWAFIFAFSALIVAWTLLNVVVIVFGAFDPYPFIFLNLVLTVVSTFQGPLIMMSQNRQTERDREAVAALHAKLDRIQQTLVQRAP